jgi:CheY-like chemotaxis protein
MSHLSLTNVRILCVDNYIDSLEPLKLLLELHGAEVYPAVSVKEAMRFFSEHRPRILVTDLALPEGNGISLMRALRRIDPSVAAVAITGVSDMKVRREALAAGFEYYLVKPVDEDVLVQAVSSIALRHHRRSA